MLYEVITGLQQVATALREHVRNDRARGVEVRHEIDVDRAPPSLERRVGVLFQDDLLFPHLSVGGNLAFGLSAEIGGRRSYNFV